MKIILLLILSLLLPMNNSFADTAPNAELSQFFGRLKAGQKQTVVAYGTSLTKYGYWVKAMDEWFGAQFPDQVTVINSGGPGQGSKWGVKNLETLVTDKKPDLVIIEFAFNDAHTRLKTSPDAARDNLDAMVSAIRARNPRVAIVLQTMNVPYDNPDGFKSSATDRPHLEEYNEIYRAYAAQHDLPIVDNYPAWLLLQTTDDARYRKMVPDGTHPNKDGHLSVTWPHLKTLLEAARDAAKP